MWFDANNKAGYVSTIISVTRSRNGATYAGVMEQNEVSNWFQRCHMTAEDFKNYEGIAESCQQILKSFREYGTPSNRRYCAVWHMNLIYDSSTSWYT